MSSSRTPSRYVQSQLETLLNDEFVEARTLQKFLVKFGHKRIAQQIAWGGSTQQYVSEFVSTCANRGIIDESFLDELFEKLDLINNSEAKTDLRVHLGIDDPPQSLVDKSTLERLKALAEQGGVDDGVIFARLGRVTLPRELRNRAAQNSFSKKDQVAAWIEAANRLVGANDGSTWMESIFQCALDENRSRNPGALRQALDLLKNARPAAPVALAPQRENGNDAVVVGQVEAVQEAQPWWHGPTIDWGVQGARTTRELLADAYSTMNELTFIGETVGIKKTTLNLNSSVLDVWGQLMEHAARANRLPYLMAAALKDDNVAGFHPKFRAAMGDVVSLDMALVAHRGPSVPESAVASLAGSLESTDNANPTEGLQAIISASNGLTDPRVFMAGLINALRRTAMIEVNGHAAGTGFLVGERHLLTNAHVVRALRNPPPPRSRRGGPV